METDTFLSKKTSHIPILAGFLRISSRSVPTMPVSTLKGRDTDLFQNRSNFDAHFDGTGPEIWRQTNGEVAGFVAGAGRSNVVTCRAVV
jgi:hypothetical protein